MPLPQAGNQGTRVRSNQRRIAIESPSAQALATGQRGPVRESGEIHRRGAWLKEVRINVCYAARWLSLEISKLRKPQRRERRSRQMVRDDDAGAPQKFSREVA